MTGANRRTRRAVLPRLTSVGLLATGAGFCGAAVNPGRGPRTVHGSLTVGPLYLPPLLVELNAVAIAGLVLIGLRWWMSSVGAMLAVILLVGSTTLGADAVSYRLSHPRRRLDSPRTGSRSSARRWPPLPA